MIWIDRLFQTHSLYISEEIWLLRLHCKFNFYFIMVVRDFAAQQSGSVRAALVLPPFLMGKCLILRHLSWTPCAQTLQKPYTGKSPFRGRFETTEVHFSFAITIAKKCRKENESNFSALCEPAIKTSWKHYAKQLKYESTENSSIFMSTLWALYPSFHIQLSPTPEITFLLKFA